MAQKSYRTMVLAMRPFDQKLVAQFEQYLTQVRSSDQKKARRMQQAFETDLTFLGITAVEDSLQWNAPQTIQRLSSSGLKIWICTGDKYETTLGVAKACQLVQHGTKRQINLLNENQEQINLILTRGADEIERMGELDLIAISGMALAVIDSDPHLISSLLQILSTAKTAIFFRMSPSQKVQVIEMAKKYLKLKVLGIGDGYNDTLMLQAADVGFRIRTEAAAVKLDEKDAEDGGDGEDLDEDARKPVQADADIIITNFFQVQKLLFAHGFYSH